MGGTDGTSDTNPTRQRGSAAAVCSENFQLPKRQERGLLTASIEKPLQERRLRAGCCLGSAASRRECRLLLRESFLQKPKTFRGAIGDQQTTRNGPFMFRPVDSNVQFPKLEEEILRLWDERRIYEKSLEQRAGAAKFVFYEGPPTANGLPHPGHCLTRAIKDLFPRYKTMRGFRCERKGGWDTHGLPVEVEVCKELGIHSKEEIERYGVEPFIHKCLESVFRYTKEWEQLTRRLGFWIHLDEAYVTYHKSYVESVWWALKTLFDHGLLYKGHKIVWWWAQGGTALSSGEVGQGYREVADPSVYVRFPLLDDKGRETGTDLLVWTTTPWTLLSNQFAAVHPELEYAIVRDEELERKLVIASVLVETIAGKVKRELTVESTCKGRDLVGRRYVPPFDYYYARLMSDPSRGGMPCRQGDVRGHLRAGGFEYEAWRVVPAAFVTTEAGTGVVHEAPAFGEVDFDVLLSEEARFVVGEGPYLINLVAPDGTFTAEAGSYQGRWVKDCDKDICRELRARGLLYHQEQYLHEYPFCWRAEDDPLIQYPRQSWFIRTSQYKEKMLANNAKINWLPEHIREGRFGNFLETNVDWALSRERYWGTPLPIWECDAPQATCLPDAVGSYDELLKKPDVKGTEAWESAKRANPNLSDHLQVHKPYIDEVHYRCTCGARRRRVKDVIDCWFDSGAMPFAQWGYPHQGREQFADQFPADFISEALDQTRGWFYSLLAISTLLFGPKQEGLVDRMMDVIDNILGGHEPPTYAFPHPYRNCIVLGLMLGEDGQKMSKSKRNYREPNEIFNRYGADAMRWFFFANQAPWTTIRYSEQSIKESIPEFLLRLWNVYVFLVTYANIDGFDPAQELPDNAGQLTAAELSRGKTYRAPSQRGELDRWILSELNRAAAVAVERMDAYDNYAAASAINEFVDALSNWYVRRSRDRFWSGEKTDDKSDGYWTLYECLLTTSKLIAPFTPFLAEAMWQNLAVSPFGSRAVESVHLCEYPAGDAAVVDERLSAEMHLVREIVSLGRSARSEANLKVRQPLAKVEIVLADARHQPWLEQHRGLICDELNVKEMGFTTHGEEYISYSVLPNLPRLGPRLGKRLPALRKALGEAEPASLLRQLEAAGQVTFNLADGPVTLDRDDIQVRLAAKPGWAAAQGRACVVVLNTELNEALIGEGLARDAVRAIQDQRKAMGLQFTDRIAIGFVTSSKELQSAVAAHAMYIKNETLARELGFKELPGVRAATVDVAGHDVQLYLRLAK
jgi:isoleucyl-tRNA synthetase